MDSADACAALAAQHLERGEPLLAYNELQEGLQRWPGHARLRQLLGLALARSADVARANEVLGELVREGASDAETVGMLARTHKDLGLAATVPAERTGHLESALRLYEGAYESARAKGEAAAAWYAGINAATTALLLGRLDRAREIAAQVREICRASASTDYWKEATLGEAELILGETERAAGHYAHALSLAKARYGDLSSTRRQLRLISAHLPDAGRLVSALEIPPVVAFTGHMLDEAGRAAPRFPATLESTVREAVRERLARLAPLALYGSAACGVDLLCLEEARALGAETHVILPFPAADFRRASVDFAGAAWGQRFDEALAAANSVTVTSDHHARGSSATFEYANLVLTGMARLRAWTLDAPLLGLAAWDSQDSGARGGAASIVSLWRAGDMPIEEIDIGALRGSPASSLTQQPAAATATRHEMRAMLFADAVGYSKLSEDQIPGYISGFLGAVAALSRRTPHRFEHVETSGDGLYMVFREVDDAARFALELSALANEFDRESCGLPPTFNLRIALHCGPVHCGVDPITGLPIYTGPHTSRTARIEPITPPGLVYASSAFAAVAAAQGLPISMTYVGRMPLAKGYGFLGLYHLRGGKIASSLRRFDPQLAGA